VKTAPYEVLGPCRIDSRRNDPTRTVPLLDLTIQYASVAEEIQDAIMRVIESQRFILGPEVEALEKELAEYCECSHAVGVSSGSDAILVSLMALEIGAGDEVITSPFTFFATVGSIVRLGAKPVFADIEPDTFNIDPVHLERLISTKTKAILPVHLFGQCAEMDPVLDIAQRARIPVIEDAAQAIGARYKGRAAGSMGTTGCFSFFPSKNLGAFGDGGLVTTNDGELAARIKILRNQGAEPKYHHRVLGGNFRLDALQAAVLRVKLKYLDMWSEKRHSNAEFYTRCLTSEQWAGGVIVPPVVKQDRHVFNQYVIRANRRDELKAFLDGSGIGSEIYYPKPLHEQECVVKRLGAVGKFPVSEEAAETVLALPIYPELTAAQQEYVLSKLREFYTSHV